jgi:hypothetical protein
MEHPPERGKVAIDRRYFQPLVTAAWLLLPLPMKNKPWIASCVISSSASSANFE